ncbi:ExeA family protein [Thermodesulfatator indicus]
MHYKFWGLSKNPFEIHPDPDFLYLSDQHREALSHLKYAVLAKKPFLLLTGDIGVGKTTLLNYFLRDLKKRKDVVLIPIFNPNLTTEDFYSLLAKEIFKSEERNESKSVFLFRFREKLSQLQSEEKILVLVIDEAQSASIPLLEELRLLANVAAEFPAMVTILVGQPDLLQKLEAPELTSLRQRLSFRYHLGPFQDFKDVKNYIAMRLIRAGSPRNRIFTDEAIGLIYEYSQGVPRVINIIADHAMINAYLNKQSLVHKDSVLEAVKEVKHLIPAKAKKISLSRQKSQKRFNWKRFLPFIFFLILTIILLTYWFEAWNFQKVNSLFKNLLEAQ